MAFPLCGDLTQYVHLGVCTPRCISFPDLYYELLPNGGVTIALRHAGDGRSIFVSAAVCSLMDNYERDVGRETCGKHGICVLNASVLPSCHYDQELGYRHVELEEVVASIFPLLNDTGLLRQFSRLSRSTGLPVFLVTRVQKHPVWAWAPDGSYGSADWAGFA